METLDASLEPLLQKQTFKQGGGWPGPLPPSLHPRPPSLPPSWLDPHVPEALLGHYSTLFALCAPYTISMYSLFTIFTGLRDGGTARSSLVSAWGGVEDVG